jgi:hypothetical protein
VSRNDCKVPRGEPHRPHFKMEHGSGLVSAGNATVRLPHCSHVGLKACLSIEATFVSIPMFANFKIEQSTIETDLQKLGRRVNAQVLDPAGLCNAERHLTLTIVVALAPHAQAHRACSSRNEPDQSRTRSGRRRPRPCMRPIRRCSVRNSAPSSLLRTGILSINADHATPNNRSQH